MKVERNKNFILTLEKGKLSIIDILTLTVFYQQEYPTGSVIACNEEYVFIGTSTGELAALNLFELDEIPVCSMGSPVTCVFHLDGFIYCGSEEGLIHVYLAADRNTKDKDLGDNMMSTFPSSLGNESINDPFSEGADSSLFKFVRSMKHPAPITQICTDGVEMFVADMRNKITVYPSKKTYDMRSPVLKYKNYVFACERNMLYCKTRAAFAVYITLKSSVSDYKFSGNGGIVFVQCGNTVYVVDFNEKEVLREMKIGTAFVYDDDRNRIIKVGDGSLVAIENVLEREYQEMDNVKFREDNIVEKKIREFEELDEEVVSQYVDCGSRRETRKKYFRKGKEVVKDEGPLKREGVMVFGKSMESAARSWQKSNIVESSEEEVVESPDVRMPGFISSALETDEGNLLCYNLEGYMTSLKNGDTNKIEVNYHDVLHRKIEIIDINNCTLGSFSGANVILGNRSKIFFISPVSKWEKEAEVKILGISEKIIATVSERIRVFRLDGTEIFNCLIPDIHTMCCSGNIIAIFSKEIILIDLFKTTQRFLLPSPVSFGCFDESGRLFYKIGNGMYCLYKGLSVGVCDIQVHPLAVFNNTIVSLAQSHKIFPHLHINHFRLADNISILLENENVLDDFEKAAEAGTKHDTSEICKENIEKDIPAVQHGTKRYNPFNK